ncbi:nucleolin-like isoform 2-T2 [Aulostomus maculatus]
MAKRQVTKRKKRLSKVVNSEVVEGDATIPEGQSVAVCPDEVEAAPTRSLESEDAGKDDSQKDIEIKGRAATVTVSWEQGEGDEAEKRAKGGDQMTGGEMSCEEQTQTVSSGDATKETASTSPETQTDVEMEQVKDKLVNGKRKAESSVETSPSKKVKLINAGFCLFVGNLNNSKTSQEIKESLANYLLTQSLLAQNIRLDRSRKYAFVDLMSEMDLTKALTLDGEMILDKPMKIAKAKVKSADKVKSAEKVKVKASPPDKKAKDSRCLFLKNLPYDATKTDILKIFGKAIDIRFPGGAEGPDKGIAFLEFKNETIANKVRQKRQGAKIQGRVLIVDSVGERVVPKVTETKKKKETKAAPPNSALFVSNLPFSVKESNVKKVFPKAVTINMPNSNGKAKGYAFVEFASVAEAEKALQASQNTKIFKRKIRVQFHEMRAMPERTKVLSKTLAVMGLADKTTAETLKDAFESCVSARVAVDKRTGVSKGFGFVEFDSEETCQATKAAMEDCEIDGNKVTVAYARAKAEGGKPVAGGGESAGHVSARGEKDKKKGKGRGAGKMPEGVKKVKNKA